MVICFVIVFVLCLYKIKFPCFNRKYSGIINNYFDDYISLEKSTSIKGVFILIVLISHANHYLQLSDSIFNSLYYFINDRIIGQSVVVMFLFYSGYGVMLSIAKKGSGYVKSIPTSRLLKVLLHFDIAVLIYLAIQTILGEKYSLYTILASFIGWENIGNSSWYIFAILVLYLATYVVFFAFKNCKNYYIPLVAVFVLIVGMMIALRHFKQDIWWYDTVILYPIGMLYYLMQDKIMALLNKKPFIYWLALGVMCVAFALSLLKINHSFIVLEIKHILFTFIIVLLTMKAQIHNKILCFLGKHLFSIFILQRIPMIIMDYFGLAKYPVLFLALSLILTIVICVPFDYLTDKLDLVIFKKKKTQTR